MGIEGQKDIFVIKCRNLLKYKNDKGLKVSTNFNKRDIKKYVYDLA